MANFAAKAANGVRVMNGLSRETRLQIMLDQDELAAIDDWRFQQRMPSRAAAIRELLRVALKIADGGHCRSLDAVAGLRHRREWRCGVGRLNRLRRA